MSVSTAEDYQRCVRLSESVIVSRHCAIMCHNDQCHVATGGDTPLNKCCFNTKRCLCRFVNIIISNRICFITFAPYIGVFSSIFCHDSKLPSTRCTSGQLPRWLRIAIGRYMVEICIYSPVLGAISKGHPCALTTCIQIRIVILFFNS